MLLGDVLANSSLHAMRFLLTFYMHMPLAFVRISVDGQGSNDDVNKVIWSAVSWGGDAGGGAEELSTVVDRTVAEYARVFISPTNTTAVADIIFGLELAWAGPLEVNEQVAKTLALVLAVEVIMTAAQARNWRLQQLRYRASYDAFLQLRLRREAAEEAAALAALAACKGKPAAVQMAIAAALVALQGVPSPTANISGVTEVDAMIRVHSLAALLFASIGMQLSVNQYVPVWPSLALIDKLRDSPPPRSHHTAHNLIMHFRMSTCIEAHAFAACAPFLLLHFCQLRWRILHDAGHGTSADVLTN